MSYRMGLARCLVAATVLSGAAGEALAAEASHRCASVAGPAERLACYDAAFPPPPAVREAAAAQAREGFGLEDAQAPLRNPGQPPEETDPPQISSRVAKVTYDSDGRTVSLENGQLWRITEATSRGHMAAGDEVVLRRGVVGNYFLVTQSGVSLRARRLR